MTFTDLSCFCRLCLLPLNGTYFDCAVDDNYDLRDTIKMVYNIDINTNDEYSTKVCHMCCDILLCNTIHYSRVVEVQKSLPRIQRIKNKIRDFGKKKAADKKEPKQPLIDTLAVDVEMIEIEPNCSKNVAATTADPCECKMDIETSEITSAQTAVPRPELNSQRMFGNLTSFKESMWPTIGENSRANDFEEDWDKEDAANNHFDINDYLIVPPMKPGIDRNNNTKPSSSFFQLAKRFCGNVRNNVECGIDEITKQLALLRFVPC